VVENAPAGIMAAKAAALHCVALTTTLSEEHLSEADAVLSSHAELSDYLFG
jgi:beta-phosphoglucomutase